MANTPDDPAAARDAALAAQLLAQVEAEFGDRLDDDARAQIGRQCAEIVAQGRALAAYPLASATEPAFTFAPPYLA